MKTTISSTGVLTITTDNETEAYALAQWQKNSLIQVDDQQRNEKWYCKGSSIKLTFVNSNVKWMTAKDAEIISDVHALVDTIILDKAADILFAEFSRLANSSSTKIEHKNGLSLDADQYKRNAKVIIGTGTKN